MAAHLCHADDCNTPVPPKMFACSRHWRLVSRRLQAALWAAYLPGQEQGKAPVTRAYRIVQARCRLAIAEAEKNTTAVGHILAFLHHAADPILAKEPPSPSLFPASDPEAAFLASVDALIDRIVAEAPAVKAALTAKSS